jgi:hypothetical protein
MAGDVPLGRIQGREMERTEQIGRWWDALDRGTHYSPEDPRERGQFLYRTEAQHRTKDRPLCRYELGGGRLCD